MKWMGMPVGGSGEKAVKELGEIRGFAKQGYESARMDANTEKSGAKGSQTLL